MYNVMLLLHACQVSLAFWLVYLEKDLGKQHWNIYLDKGGNFRRTFLPKVYDGQLLIHPFPRINAIWLVLAYRVMIMLACHQESKLLIFDLLQQSLTNITIWGPFFMHEIHDGLNLPADDAVVCSFGILYVNFPTDGREHFTGCSDDSIYVYDLEANKLLLRVLAHTVD
ncbi:hypothetical protein RHGRI_014326 [Rhododendron griersonianum]|uniref:Uncharacterized protein n=1 Tax=Rhododendron griersonianum TaxID=479676 RepID=A0AAV6K949_9ERIC|nr:hypothetical protein RHGRI_014326 [Rhododendron griersonianum]